MKEIILGCWQIGGMPSFHNCDESEAISLLEYAYEQGIRSFDTAPIYGNGRSEIFLGKALKNKRKDIRIITKFGYTIIDGQSRYDVSKEGIDSQIHASLERLQSDTIDAYLLHIPEIIRDIDEIITTLNEAKKKGYIQSYGLCNTQGKLLSDFLHHTASKIDIIQDFYNIIDRSIEMTIFPYIDEKIEFMAYSPFYRGGLTNTSMNDLFDKGENAINAILKNQNLREFMKKRKIGEIIAERSGISLMDLALRFLVGKKEVQSIIFGTKNKDHLKELLERMESIS